MKTTKLWSLVVLIISLAFLSCESKEFGANEYDPNTPITTSQMPKVFSFTPIEGKTGDTITIKGINFSTAQSVSFGGKSAASFEIINDSVIEAVIGFGGSGTVSITNHKGTKFLEGFIYIFVVPPTPNPNLALNKPATASASFNSESLAVDGDLGTRWSALEGDNHWYKVDLQRIYEINRIHIDWEGAFASEFELQVSTDDVNFTTVYSTTTGEGGAVDYKFEDTPARYVKISLHKRGTPWNMSFWEFEVYADPPPVNLALFKTGSSSGDFNSPSLALDGDPGTRWSAIEGDNHWFKVDLGSKEKVGRVFIMWEAAYASEYTIELSTDDTDYTTVFSTTTGVGGDVNHTFTQTDARYVRIQLIKGGTPWNMSFWELQVFEK